MKVSNYKDLIVWQKAMDLSVALYKSTSSFPKEEVYGITAQMRRAAVSVVSNIAEGHSRNTTGEYRQFLGVAKGSLCELETQIMLSNRLNYLSDESTAKLLSISDEVGKMIVAIKAKLT